VVRGVGKVTALKRRVILGLGFLACLGLLSLLAWWITLPTHQITEENIAKIEMGMTEVEVESVLGVPAGNYARQRTEMDFMIGRRLRALSPHCKDWIGDEAGVRVAFDANDRVEWLQPGVIILINETALEKLRRWFRL
jgi:hypothetical protein